MPARDKAIFAFFGLIASGKSTLAEAWAERLGVPYWNSDRVRKELAGRAAASGRGEAPNAGIYTPEFSRRTYDALLDRATAALTTSPAVVLDASYSARAERDRLRARAAAIGARLRFILCACPEPVARERMDRRAQDPNAVSDGRWEIYLAQKSSFQAPGPDEEETVTIDTNRSVAELLDHLARLLGDRHSSDRHSS